MTIVDILFSLLFLLGLIYLAFFRFKQYRMDRFRQNIFALRDELFDYAAKGNISFNHPAYITLRNLMNGYIRFSHRISLLQVMILKFADRLFDRKYHPKTFDEVWAEVTEDLDVEVKRELDIFNTRASANLFYYVFLSSVLKKIVVIPCLLLLYLLDESKEGEDEAEAVLTPVRGENGVEVLTYQYGGKRVEESIEHLNTDALVFGSNKASVASV